MPKSIKAFLIIAGLVGLSLIILFSRNSPPGPVPSPSPAQIVVTKDDHVLGDFDAPITIVEWTDFQCPFCALFHQTMKQIMTDYPNQVRWVFRHFPLKSIHPFAFKAALASECAAEQGKFWEYGDELYLRQKDFGPLIFEQIATNLNLNKEQFKICLDSQEYKSKIAADYDEGLKNGVRGTPGNFINGQELGGNVPYSQLKKIIDSLITK